MATSLNELGLVANTDYTNTNMMVIIDINEDLNEEFKVIRTANKIVFVENEGTEKRVTLKKIVSCHGSSDGMVTKEAKKITHNDLGYGILSNTNYIGTGTVIIHKNLGEMELVRTSEKMLFVLDNNGDIKRMKVDMMIGTGGDELFVDVPSEDAMEMEKELDSFFDNDFIQSSFNDDTTDTGVVYD